MSIRRTLAIARKEFRHIFRDLRTFFLVTVSPAFLLLTLSHIFVLDVQRVDLALWDLDGTPLSRQYIRALTADNDFQVRFRVGSYEELDRLLLAGQVDGGLVIPSGFARRLQGGRLAQVEAVMDGTDPIATNQAVFGLSQRSAAFAARFQGSVSVLARGLDARTEAWYNPTLKSLTSMVPGLAAIVLCMPALALALALARERETGSFESLIATPVRGAEYLLGKLTAYICSGTLSVVLVWLVAVGYFKVPFRGNFLTYLLLAADYLLASMGFSLFIANFVRSQQTAMFVVLMVFFVPSFFVAGLVSPVDTRSLASQAVAYSLPATHFIAISRSVFLKGSNLTPLTLRTVALAGMGLAGLTVSLLMFRKRLG